MTAAGSWGLGAELRGDEGEGLLRGAELTWARHPIP
jgi:hypothetical protein